MSVPERHSSSQITKVAAAACGIKNRPPRLDLRRLELSQHRTRYLFVSKFLTTFSADGKLYLRRGRFTDTWAFHHGNWVCVASQSMLIGK
ncbi:MAG TPA: hypothetical protein VHW45_00910 [Candidatus Sulfotelmatobacter sp.]|jgi:hypothetical protein|nr:hypothetical protein [Candidatus Sulfotelmatobacter sp.]